MFEPNKDCLAWTMMKESPRRLTEECDGYYKCQSIPSFKSTTYALSVKVDGYYVGLLNLDNPESVHIAAKDLGLKPESERPEPWTIPTPEEGGDRWAAWETLRILWPNSRDTIAECLTQSDGRVYIEDQYHYVGVYAQDAEEVTHLFDMKDADGAIRLLQALGPTITNLEEYSK
jgi:hypothetical protein